MIGRRTRRLLGDLFELADLGLQHLKGFTEPLWAWRVLGESRAESRFEAFHVGGLMPLVGREHELGLLLDRWERAKEGEGQVVLLSGEAGIGKSRLLRAVRERLGDQSYTPLSHFCSPYRVNSALYPVINLLERNAGITRDDPPPRQLERLEALLVLSDENLAEAASLLAALLSIPADERYPPLELTPQRRKQRTLEVLLKQLEGLATRQPVLSIWEDLHWIDPSSLELLDMVVDRVQRLPVLVLMAYRPEFNPSWAGYAHVTTLTLNRLGRREGAAMIERVAEGKALPFELVEQILRKTDGVPLFVEELTKTVLETGLVTDAGDHYALSGPVPPLAIPATLHDSLMARLDRLAPVKEVAQIGAVIGREFSYALLAAVADRPEDQLCAALDQLTSTELIFRRGTPPEASSSFKHALVQDAAYQSLLKSKRQQLHARIAQVLSVQEVVPEVLGHHLTEGG